MMANSGGGIGSVVLQVNEPSGFLTVYIGGVSTTFAGAMAGKFDRWTHVAVAFDEPSGSLKLYVDGVQFGSTATNAGQWSVSASNPTLSIGVYGGQWWDGKMAWVSVHERALTATEIENAYNIAVGEYWNMLTDSPNYTNHLVIDPGTNSLTIKGF